MLDMKDVRFSSCVKNLYELVLLSTNNKVGAKI